MIQKKEDIATCSHMIKAIHDAMYMIGGKWKISIIASLCFGTKRYSDILKEVNGISGKMLSRELKEMEVNKLITRNVVSTHPIKVEYALTEQGLSLYPVIKHLAGWAIEQRKIIFQEN